MKLRRLREPHRCRWLRSARVRQRAQALDQDDRDEHEADGNRYDTSSCAISEVAHDDTQARSCEQRQA